MVSQQSPLRRNPTLVSLDSSLELQATLPTQSGALDNITLNHLPAPGIPEGCRCLGGIILKEWWLVAIRAC